MNRTKEEKLSIEIDRTYHTASEIINKGIIGNNYFRLENTLELHQRIKILLDELNYTLSRDIPIDDCIDKAVSVRESMNSDFEELLNSSKYVSHKRDYLQFVESVLYKEYGDALIKTYSSASSFCYSVEVDGYVIPNIKGSMKFNIQINDDGRIRIETELWESGRNATFKKVVDILEKMVTNNNYSYDYGFNYTENRITVIMTRNIQGKEIINCIYNMMRACIKFIRLSLDIITTVEDDDMPFFDIWEAEEDSDLDEECIDNEVAKFGKVIENAFDSFRETLIEWIQELQDIFSSLPKKYNMNNFLESELNDLFELNDDNLYLHYIMIVDKLDSCLEKHRSLNEVSELTELIAEMKRWEDESIKL